MASSQSKRILATPSSYAKKNYLYVQEVGTLTSLKPHISSRDHLDSFLFFMVLEGAGYLTYHGKRFFLTKGCCVWIDCRVPYSHESSTTDPWTLTWVHFYGTQAPTLYQSYVNSDMPVIFTPQTLTPFSDCIYAIYQRQTKPGALNELYCNKYLTDLITLCYEEGSLTHHESSNIGEKLESVRAYLEEHYMDKLSLDELSEHFFISKYHLAREYRRCFGITIGNDITARRVSRAKSLLRFTQDSIEEISTSCGFSDAGYFIKVFKRQENMTPLEYRHKW